MPKPALPKAGTARPVWSAADFFPDREFITVRDILDAGLFRTADTLRAALRRGDFPQPLRRNGNPRGKPCIWVTAEARAWIAARMVERPPREPRADRHPKESTAQT